MDQDQRHLEVNWPKVFWIVGFAVGVFSLSQWFIEIKGDIEDQVSAHGVKIGLQLTAKDYWDRSIIVLPLGALLFAMTIYKYRNDKRPLLYTVRTQSPADSPVENRDTKPKGPPLTVAEIWRNNPGLTQSARERVRKKLEYRARQNPALCVKVKRTATEFENAYDAQIVGEALEEERKTHGESSP